MADRRGVARVLGRVTVGVVIGAFFGYYVAWMYFTVAGPSPQGPPHPYLAMLLGIGSAAVRILPWEAARGTTIDAVPVYRVLLAPSARSASDRQATLPTSKKARRSGLLVKQAEQDSNLRLEIVGDRRQNR